MAREYDTASAIIDAAVRNHLGSLRFGAPTSGRAYATHGDDLAAALAELSAALRVWSRAAAEIAARADLDDVGAEILIRLSPSNRIGAVCLGPIAAVHPPRLSRTSG